MSGGTATSISISGISNIKYLTYSKEYSRLYLTSSNSSYESIYYLDLDQGGNIVPKLNTLSQPGSDDKNQVHFDRGKIYVVDSDGGLHYANLNSQGDLIGGWSTADEPVNSHTWNGVCTSSSKVFVLQGSLGLRYKSITDASSDNGKAFKMTDSTTEDLFGIIGNSTSSSVSIANNTSTKVRVGGVQSGLTSGDLTAGSEKTYFGKRAGVALSSSLLFVDPDIS